MQVQEDYYPDHIEADMVMIEVVDRETGQVFRRQLPLHYLETDNGVMLSGENVSGEPVQITFLSDIALAKMKDLLGQGPDKPRCGDEHK